MSLQPVRGTRDLFENDLEKYRRIISIAEKIALTYGYQALETPILEYASVFQKTLGETSDIVGKETYTFNDRGGELITLRPEGTAPVMRSIISAGLTQTLPQKRIYSGPMFRYERPQKGRYRQFYQLGIEYIGVASPYSDVECIALADQLLKALGINDYTLHLNTLGDTESRQNYRQALIEYLTKFKDDLSEDSKTRLQKNPLRILDSKDDKDREICAEAPLFDNYLNAASQEFFKTVCRGLETIGINFTHDQHLVRGLDYYCHTAFEFKSDSLGAQDTILGGGRYDGLSQQMGGPATLPSVGWAMGIDRICLILPPQNESTILKVAVIPIGDDMQVPCIKLTQDLRQAGIPVELSHTGNLGKRLKQADKLNCRFAILLGSDELANNCVKVRDLQLDTTSQNKEQNVPLTELLSYLSSFNKMSS